MPNYDPEQAKGGNFEPIPTGTYPCKIKEVVPTKTKDGKSDMFKLQLQVNEGEYYKRIIFDQIVFSPKGMTFVKILCGALGYDTSKPFSVEPNDLKGKDVLVDVIQDTYEGKPKNVVGMGGYHKITDDNDSSLPF
jgi:hypothetical protein